MLKNTNKRGRPRGSVPMERLKFTLYAEQGEKDLIDEAYTNYCEEIRNSDMLVQPFSKSSWILALVRRCIIQDNSKKENERAQ